MDIIGGPTVAHKKALLQLGPCPECGKHFESRYVKTYCGMKCYLKSPTFKAQLQANNDKKKKEAEVKGTCLQCGVEFSAKASLKKKFCSRNHYRTYFAERFDRWIASPQAVALPQAYDEFLTLDELPCLIEGCDWHGSHLGQHLNFAHGIPADQFKKLAGFNKNTGLVTPALSQAIASRPHLAFASLPPGAFEKAMQAQKARRGVSLEAKEHLAKARALAGEEAKPKARTCRGCGKPFQQEHHFGAKQYCTLECRSAYYARNLPYVTLVCSECGETFQTQSKDQQRRSAAGLPVFHSKTCRQKRNGRFRTLRKPKHEVRDDTVSVSYLGAEGEKWSERLDSNQRPLSPQKTGNG
jgi:hypothetical protein